MTRIMVDSTNVLDDPLTAQMVAYYIDGIYATTEAAVRGRFPAAVLVPISAIGTNAGVVGDVEPGCMTVSQSISWVTSRRAAGIVPTLYCNELNLWASVQAAFTAAKVAQPYYWVADYDNVQVIPSGAIAKQYANPALTGGHFDNSIVADYWPGVDSVVNIGGKKLDSASLAQLIYLAGLGRVYVGTEGDWLVQVINSNPTDFTGSTIGAVVNSTEGKAWAAKLIELRAANTTGLVTADELTAAIAALPAPLTKADVDAAVAAAVAALPPAPAPSLWQVLKNTIWP